MPVFSFRAAVAGAILASAPLLTAIAADAPPANPEQARIEQAFAAKMRADQQRARDQAVVSRVTDLQHDPGTPFLGNPDGDVVIVEFFDYTCPFCKAVEPRLEKLLAEDKNVKLILKDFPILRPQSVPASKAALASVKQGKHAAFHRALIGFRGQLQVDTIFDIAKEVGLDVERLRKDMDSPEIADQIIENFNLARALRVTSTPEFVIGNRMILESSVQIDFPKAVAAARGK